MTKVTDTVAFHNRREYIQEEGVSVPAGILARPGRMVDELETFYCPTSLEDLSVYTKDIDAVSVPVPRVSRRGAGAVFGRLYLGGAYGGIARRAYE